MNTFNYEKYVEEQLFMHNDNHNHDGMTKDDLYKILDEKKIKYKKSALKEELYKKVINEAGVTIDELADRFKVGVFSGNYQEKFGITHADVKRLAKFEVLRIVGYLAVRDFGKVLYIPKYDVKQFYEMTAEDMQELLKKYPKGLRKKKL